MHPGNTEAIRLDYPDGATRYAKFLTSVFGSTTTVREGLPLADPVPIPEIELQARWFAGEFGRAFTTTGGQAVRILQFGHWNRSAGPDFTEAAVEIDGEKRAGAIEIEIDAAGWEAHGHATNPGFDEVVLQVFLRQPKGERFYTRNSRHQEIAQVRLDPAVVIQSGAAFNWLPEARLGRCAAPLAEMSRERIESLFVGAAQFRLMQKANRLKAIADAHTENQALFQAVAETLGYRHNKVVMAILAQRLPMKDLRRFEPIEREALLFGVAGFIGHEQFESADPDARTYLKSLWDHWWKLRGDFEPEAEKQLAWTLGGVRPTNHPQRRVGALAALANRWTSFRSLATGESAGKTLWPKQLRDFLSGLEHDYWQRHYTLQSKPAKSSMALIGKDRVQDILGNLLFPLALRERSDAWQTFRELPGSVSNESLRRATLRLFGEDHPDAADFSKKYYQQQALLQIYRDFCLEDTSECEECPFPEQLRQWG